MKGTFGIARGAGSVDSIAGILGSGFLVAAARFFLQHFPVNLFIDNQFGPAVPADVFHPLSGIISLGDGASRSGAPNANEGHGNFRPPGQIYQHEILFADMVFFQIGIDFAGQMP